MMRGELKVYTGPMFSGKTSKMIAELRKYGRYTALKPDNDSRYSEGKIVSHEGDEMDAVIVEEERIFSEVSKLELDKIDALGIDETQFFGEDIEKAVEHALERGVDVILTGLDKDFRGEPFQPVPRMVELSDKTEFLTARCGVCGEKASFSQRFIDGEPAHFDSPQIVVGSSEKYEPRCGEHHTVRKG